MHPLILINMISVLLMLSGPCR